MLILDRGNVIDNWTDIEFYTAYERTYIPGSKTAAVYKDDMYYSVVLQKMNRTDHPKLLDGRFMLEARAFAFSRNHFLLEIFDRKLQQYIEADLVNYHYKHYYDRVNPKAYEKSAEPFAILTMGELEAGFVVCLVPLALSIVVFAIELLTKFKEKFWAKIARVLRFKFATTEQ